MDDLVSTEWLAANLGSVTVFDQRGKALTENVEIFKAMCPDIECEGEIARALDRLLLLRRALQPADQAEGVAHPQVAVAAHVLQVQAGDAVARSSGQLALLLEGIDWRRPERTWTPSLAG